jgi:curved DNA-binding protein CbpA
LNSNLAQLLSKQNAIIAFYMEKKNYYKILQVDPSAEPEVIVAAYKRLALKYHPDTNKSSDATQRMQEINSAYQILSDPLARSFYDKENGLQKDEGTKQDFSEKQHGKAHDQATHDTKKRLIYSSDFNTGSNLWMEETSASVRSFRRAGHYHIAVNRSPWEQYYYPKIQVENFSVEVDAEFLSQSGKTSEYGIVFRLQSNSSKDNYYRFAISKSGYYSLHIHLDGNYQTLQEYKSSSKIITNGGTNTLMAKMVGENITLGVNGYVLARLTDSKISSGNVGLIASAQVNDLFAEARFTNFRLFSLATP